MVMMAVRCPYCESTDVKKHGFGKKGQQKVSNHARPCHWTRHKLY